MTIRLGTRGSDLALWQAHHVRDLLASRAGVQTEIVVVETQGDLDQARALSALGSQGVFTKELENALLAREVDVAVHSHKDMPTASPDDLEVVAIPLRGPIRDGLVVRAGVAYPLPGGACVGTGSARRRAQLLAARPDLQIADLRGNVPTRLAKLARTHPGDWSYDAIVLAEAGLVRLGLDPAPHRVVLFDPRELVPAPAQGALALQVRTDVAGDVRARPEPPSRRAHRPPPSARNAPCSPACAAAATCPSAATPSSTAAGSACCPSSDGTTAPSPASR